MKITKACAIAEVCSVYLNTIIRQRVAADKYNIQLVA